MTDDDLLQLEVETSYVLDARRRLVQRNERNGAAGESFLVARTATSVRWWIGADVSETLARELDRLGASEPVTTDRHTPPRCRDEVVELLAGQGRERHGPSWIAPAGMSDDERAVPIDERNARLLADGFDDLIGEIGDLQPCFAVLDKGRAVSVCFSSRVGKHGCAAGANTLAEFRGRGLVGIAVSAWATEVQRTNRVAFYGTSWDNLASQRVATKLGMRLFADVWYIAAPQAQSTEKLAPEAQSTE